MLPAPDIQNLRDELASAFRYRYADPDRRVRLVGIAFAPHTATLARDELLPRLNEFHTRSANHVDLFWAGYGRYWGPLAPSDTKEIPGQDPPWLYSQTLFETFRQQLEDETRWHYSGEVDLLLLNARYDKSRQVAELQLKDVVAVDLARAIADGAVFSAARLLQDLFRYAETQDDHDPAWGFGGQQAGRNVGEGLIHALLSSLPVDLKVLWKQGRHFQFC